MTNEIKIFLTYSKLILLNKFKLLLVVAQFSGNVATYSTFQEIASDLQYKLNYYIYATISFHHEDGLLLQLQINIRLSRINFKKII